MTPDRTQIGIYAGLITSLFAFSQLCTTFWWGILSDRVGRKPILLSGLTGLSISIISFGVQRSFAGLVVARCIAGIMNGNVAVVKSALAELTDETNKARAFALLPMSGAIGTILGPMVGGYLAKPADQYPGLFGNVEFLKAFPYFLPCFVAGIVNLLAVVLGFVYLEETLHSKTRAKTSTLIGEEDPLLIGASNEPPMQPPRFSFLALLTPNVIAVLLSFTVLCLKTSAWATVVPMFAYTRVEEGGLGLSLNQIGTALSTNGFAAIIIQVALFPYLQRRWGTLKVFQAVLLIWPFAFGFLPLVRWSTIRETRVHGPVQGAWVALSGLVCVLVFKSLVGMAMVCIALLINSAAPSASSFGALNGLGQSCSALARTFSPVATGALFSLSIRKNYLGGNLVWVVAVVVSICSCIASRFMRIELNDVTRKLKRPSPPV